MKIIKMCKSIDADLEWGLGEDGRIYYRWKPTDNWNLYLAVMKMKDIMHLAKEFGHLLVWL
jgi:hypothetical protein